MADRLLSPLESDGGTLELTRAWSIGWIAALAVSLHLTAATAGETETIFTDHFDRPDAETVGNDWSSKGSVILKNKAAHFAANEEEFRPRMKHRFPVQEEGKFTVSFRMDWLRESEGTWGFYMQLGNSEEIPKRLVYLDDLWKGIGVNLVWGGGELVNHEKAGSLGYLKGGQFKPLVVINDNRVKSSVVEKAVVTIEVDLDSNSFRLSVGGKTYNDLPLDNEGPIDTIRFITNGCSASGFRKSSIDNVLVTRQK